MNTRIKIKYLWLSQPWVTMVMASLVLVVSAGCAPGTTQPLSQPAPVATNTQAAATSLPTATSEATIPAGWATYTSERCEYAIDYPPEMQVTSNGTYSRLLDFKTANPVERTPNFIYLSVIDQDIQSLGEEGVYNYDPGGAEILLNMQVGESQSLSGVPNLADYFTYQRQPDTMISGYVAKAYQNLQPWEFPAGTKENRYYLSQNGCMYLIGGYLDTTGSNQPGAITEDLFNQIIATIRLMP